MKAILPICAFLAAALIASPLIAKPGEPIAGVPIGLEGDPGSVVISQAKTNGEGVAVFRNVKPGKYQLTINQVIRTGTAPASIEINIPGQAKVVGTISKANALSKTREDLNFSIRFIVAGNRAQTVTVFLEQTLGLGF
jgi:hypothetical protein